ncbi:MAG: thiolase C-terminal domain-containing protein [Candidatus Helarchaeota archaeon]
MGKLLREVAIVGAGMSKFGAFPDKNSRDLWVEAFLNCKETIDKGIDVKAIEALYIGNYSSDLFEGQGHIAPMCAELAGLTPKPALRTENACASSGIALREGVIAIASGAYDIICVGGVEKMTDLPTAGVTDTLASAADRIFEFHAGVTFPGLYAMMATAHMAKYGTEKEDFMRVGIKNHKNGALNPFAQMNKTVADIMKGKIAKAEKKGKPKPTWKDEMDFLHDLNANPYIAYPMRLFDCSLVTDGAACLILCAKDLAKKYTDTPIYIVGTGQGSETFAIHDRPSLTSLRSAKSAAQMAYKMAGVEPKDIQIAEVHDCFTIAELVAMGDLGFWKPEDVTRAVREGETALDGSRPLNTSGGLKSKGHPVGATGVAQAVEIWKQMRGQAEGKRQVKFDVECALTHNVGGSGGSCVVHVYKK